MISLMILYLSRRRKKLTSRGGSQFDEHNIYIGIDKIIYNLPDIWKDWLNHVIDYKQLENELKKEANKYRRKQFKRQNRAIDLSDEMVEAKCLCTLAVVLMIVATIIFVIFAFEFSSFKVLRNHIDRYTRPVDDFRSTSCIDDSSNSIIRLKFSTFDEVILTKQRLFNRSMIESMLFYDRLQYQDVSVRSMRASNNETCVPVRT